MTSGPCGTACLHGQHEASCPPPVPVSSGLQAWGQDWVDSCQLGPGMSEGFSWNTKPRPVPPSLALWGPVQPRMVQDRLRGCPAPSLNSTSDCGGRHGWQPPPPAPAGVRAQHRCELLFTLQPPFPQFATCKPGRACQRGRGCACARQHQPWLVVLVGSHKGNFQHKDPMPERERGELLGKLQKPSKCPFYEVPALKMLAGACTIASQQGLVLAQPFPPSPR